MKIRTDFISNSSSSSFILTGENAHKGLIMLKSLCDKYQMPYDLEDNFLAYVYFKVQDISAFEAVFGEEDVLNSVHSEKDIYYVKIPMSYLNSVKLTKDFIGKIEKVMFKIYNDDLFAKISFKLFYLYFEKVGCSPDMADSETDFLTVSTDEKFMYALATGPELQIS